MGEKPLPARPEAPLEDVPFDFHRFLDQLKHKSADPVARYLRSFLTEFSKKPRPLADQVKAVSDFLIFIHEKMLMCDVWRNCSPQNFDNAKEGMEKLVMNRLYSQCFSPAIKDHISSGHSDDLERDKIVAQKIEIFSWTEERHLDIPSTQLNESFLSLAEQELLKIKNYRAPRDKLICILNCCKVIFGLLRHAGSEESADKFVPILIYVVLKAKPEHLVSNVQYISRFRAPEKLAGEGGYYLSSLIGAISFIENLDRNALTITDDEFEENLELNLKRLRDAEENKQILNNKNLPEVETSNQDQSSQESSFTFLRSLTTPLLSVNKIFTPTEPVNSSSGTRSLNNPTPPAMESQIETSQRQTSLNFTADQIALENEQAKVLFNEELKQNIETLVSMFPNISQDVIEDVIKQFEGRMGVAVETLLQLSGE